MKKIYLLIFMFCAFYSFSDTTADAAGESEKSTITSPVFSSYDEAALSMTFRESYDPLFPLNRKDYYFFQGTNPVSRDELIAITQDELLLKNEKRIKQIQRGGYTAGGVLGGFTFSFLVPSIVFIVLQTN